MSWREAESMLDVHKSLQVEHKDVQIVRNHTWVNLTLKGSYLSFADVSMKIPMSRYHLDPSNYRIREPDSEPEIERWERLNGEKDIVFVPPNAQNDGYVFWTACINEDFEGFIFKLPGGEERVQRFSTPTAYYNTEVKIENIYLHPNEPDPTNGDYKQLTAKAVRMKKEA